MIYKTLDIKDYRNGLLKDYISQSTLKARDDDDDFGFKNSWVGSVVHRILELGDKHIKSIRAEFVNQEAVDGLANERLKADRDPEHLFDNCITMATSVLRDIDIFDDIKSAYYDKSSMREVSMTTEYAGLKMKCRPDFISADGSLVIDWKTTSDIENFERSIWKYMYDVQAYFYSMVTCENFSDPFAEEKILPQFMFFVVDKKRFKTGVYRMSPESMETGHKRLDSAIVKYKQYKAGEIWTATDNEIKTVNPPRYLEV